MAKRSNPYAEDFIQQSKMHVGLKQFNNNEDRLKKVYDKTLELLFQGAKKTQQYILHNDNNNSTERKDSMKQLFIGKNGTLLHTGNIKISKGMADEHCACSGMRADNCSYCETALCAVCQHHCVLCMQSYCVKCSLIGSEGTEVLCLSCYS